MNTYFNGSMTSDQMKMEYRKLVKQYHPDLHPGISEEHIKEINNQFSYWYARAAGQEVKDSKTAEYGYKDFYNTYTSQGFIDSLEACINFILNNNIDRVTGLTAELCGVFIWISGENLKYDAAMRGILSSQGFKYSGNKKAWYYTPTSTRWHPATSATLEYIRNKYGSTIIKHKDYQLS